MRTVLDFNGKEIQVDPLKDERFPYRILFLADPANPQSIFITQDQMDMLDLVALMLKETK